MAILVHNGATGATYNSYASVVAADAYHLDRATTAWTSATAAAKEAALIRATDYIDATYRFTTDPFAGGVVNPLLTKATMVMAVYALTSTLAEKLDDRGVASETKALEGVGSKSVTYDPKRTSDPYPLVTRILAPLGGNTSSSIVIGKVLK